jgi:hypothetical protein
MMETIVCLVKCPSILPWWNLNVSSDGSRMATPARKAAGGRRVVKAAGPLRKRPIPEGDMSATRSEDGLPHKRARVVPENISSPRVKPSRGKNGKPTSKPRKPAPPRVRKTYRNRPKTERSSPGHSANRHVDYDEIPPSTTILGSPTANECNLPAATTGDPILTSSLMQTESRHWTTPSSSPTGRPGPADERVERANKAKLKQGDTRLIQVPPPEVILEDDDPIQSFSSSPCEPLSLDDAAVKVFEIFFIACHVIFILCSLDPMSQLPPARVLFPNP